MLELPVLKNAEAHVDGFARRRGAQCARERRMSRLCELYVDVGQHELICEMERRQRASTGRHAGFRASTADHPEIRGYLTGLDPFWKVWVRQLAA